MREGYDRIRSGVSIKYSTELANKALSTTFTPDNLMSWYKEQLGGPVAFRFKWDKNLEWHYSEYLSMRDYYDSATLYAPKLDVKG